MKQRYQHFFPLVLLFLFVLLVSSYFFIGPGERVVGETLVESLEIPIYVGESSYHVSVPAGSSVFDAMSAAKARAGLIFLAYTYSGLGYFVEEINGIRNGQGEYWTLYVNGVYSKVGASSYELRKGDTVEWKFEKR